MHYDRSCFLSRCVTTIQKIVSQNRSAIRGELVQIARCVYVTRTREKLSLLLHILNAKMTNCHMRICGTNSEYAEIIKIHQHVDNTFCIFVVESKLLVQLQR